MDSREAIQYFKATQKTLGAACGEHIGLAIEALEKQVPQRPLDHPRAVYGICPSCHDFLDGDEGFCGSCGQALDWSEGDD